MKMKEKNEQVDLSPERLREDLRNVAIKSVYLHQIVSSIHHFQKSGLNHIQSIDFLIAA